MVHDTNQQSELWHCSIKIYDNPEQNGVNVKEQFWKDTMTEESMMKKFVPRSQGRSHATSKWLYKMKHEADRSTEKFKEDACVEKHHGFELQNKKDFICR